MLIAAVAAVAGIALASQHPIAPNLAVAVVLACIVASATGPWRWWAAVPALLPWLDFSPWTGALIVDEFDLFLLAVLAGAWARVAWERRAPSPVAGRGGLSMQRLLQLVFVVAAGGMVCGLLRAERPWPGSFQGYGDALNAVRVTKSIVFALFFAPLARRGLRADPGRALGRLCLGMWVGMAVVAASVVAERIAFPGLFDFSDPYRTTALFWEMHVGGAAIDVYAVLGAPFAVWAVWSARTVAQRLASALLALAWGYVCLTTFSRGVWLAVLLSLTLLAVTVWLARMKRELRWRRVGDAMLVLALLAEIAVVAGSGTFMGERLAASDQDFSSRRVHWRDGLRSIQTPLDWIIGIGAGRLPARYAAEVPQREFSGGVRAVTPAAGPARSYAALAGPRSQPSLGGLFALTQRVPLRAGERYGMELSLRPHGSVRLEVLVCEMHLLYPRRCQGVVLKTAGSAAGTWQRVRLPLAGPPLDPGSWFAPRAGVLLLSVLDAGAVVDVTDVDLRAGQSAPLVRNPAFADGLAGWFPLAQRYFLPWHIDNFFLETLIEHGLAGLLVLAALVVHALVAVVRVRPAPSPAVAPFLGAAIVAVLLVGAVSSVADAPRVAFAFWWLVVVAGELRSAQLRTTPPAASRAGSRNAARALLPAVAPDTVCPSRNPSNVDPS